MHQNIRMGDIAEYLLWILANVWKIKEIEICLMFPFCVGSLQYSIIKRVK